MDRSQRNYAEATLVGYFFLMIGLLLIAILCADLAGVWGHKPGNELLVMLVGLISCGLGLFIIIKMRKKLQQT